MQVVLSAILIQTFFKLFRRF